MKDKNIALYQTMYLIRMCEEKIRVHYPSDKLKTPVHLCIGLEAIVAGVIFYSNRMTKFLEPIEIMEYILLKVVIQIVFLEKCLAE